MEQGTVKAWLQGLRLRRVVTSNRFIPQVDGFRFLAILIVVVAHVLLLMQPPALFTGRGSAFLLALPEGRIGVFLFFTISGFILALPFARHHLSGGSAVPLGKYFRRRVTRLEPPYILAMLIRVPLLLIYKRPDAHQLGWHLLASLFYLHNLVYAHSSSINPPNWSLEVEIQFYLLAPLLTGVFAIRERRLRQYVLAISIVLATVLTLLPVMQSDRMALTVLNFGQYFLAGFLLCDVYLSGNQPNWSPWLWDLVGVAGLVVIFWRWNWWTLFLFPFATLALYLAGFHGLVVRRVFSSRVLSLIGGMCYSLYLTHSLVLVGLARLLPHLRIGKLGAGPATVAMFAIAFAAALVMGTLYYVLIERPCMDPAWPQKLLAWWRERRASAVAV